jgi:predicted O-linked N-acetylglucosamine transferase (SPINDLY family)
LKIGYFSADYHDHPVMYLIIRLFELHDRERFEIYSYSFGPPSDSDLRKRLVAATHFKKVNHLSDREVAQLARADGLHVAVDLSGFTQKARTGIFAYRAAPVQVNFLGYPGTLGARFMDYIIADEVVIPVERANDYTESVIQLPGSYLLNDDTRQIAEHGLTRQQAGLPEEGFVFCCFNNSYKITPEEYDIWMRLLQRVEGSVLWLRKTNETAMSNLRAAAEARGVDGSRLVFAGRAPLAEYLARHRLADLFLDTFNYNAHTTASDALFAGLPVLTRPGRSFPARVAASLLHAVGLEETICNSVEAYENLALELASDPARLAAITDKLAANRGKTLLFDSTASTRAMENAYTAAFARFMAGQPPAMIKV